MSRLLRRLASVGSVFLGFITIIPILARDLFGLTDAVALGGTSLLIIISTGIEGMKQLEGYLLKRKYVGFMAVSYTHLDVYKRQVWIYRGEVLPARKDAKGGK